MAKQSAGLILYRRINKFLEVFLVHPGGPFYSKRDNGVWSIPKGEFINEEPLIAAQREFNEETGFFVSGDFIELTPVKQKSGKKVFAWAIEADVDPSKLISNTFTLEFPPKTGKIQEYPEVDRAQWFSTSKAKEKILVYQMPIIEELTEKLGIEENFEEDDNKFAENKSQPSLFE